jgi:hypothetical protein
MTGRCPHCGAEVRQGARFCRRCGFDLAPTGPAQPSSDVPAGAPVYVRQQDVTSIKESGVTHYPFSPNAGYSVVKALAPSGPAKGSFWVGLALFLGGFGLASCQVLLMLALDVGAEGEQPPLGINGALGISGCLLLVLSLVGVLLIAGGRPRAAR